MAQVNACIAEANTGQSGCEKHLALRLKVIRILDCARQILDSTTEGVEGKDV